VSTAEGLRPPPAKLKAKMYRRSATDNEPYVILVNSAPIDDLEESKLVSLERVQSAKALPKSSSRKRLKTSKS
jgi:hypothetical protein